MKKRSTLMALMLALFTVILGLNSVQAAATTKTVINDKIWWRNDYGDPSHPFEKADDFKYIGDVASNNWGVFYFSKSGDLSWYSPKSGKSLDVVTLENLKRINVLGAYEGGDAMFGRYVAGQNYLKGYDTLDKIKAAMNKPKGTTPAVPVAPKDATNDQYKPNDPTPAIPAEPTTPAYRKDPGISVTYTQPKNVATVTPAPKQGWIQDKGNWFYYDQQGRQKSGWVQVGGAWYYLASDGKMQTGWVSQGGVWYYLNGSGAMQTGWLNQSGTWYYLNGSGAMQTGWLSLSGTWYYLTASGSMKTGWYQVSTKWYYSYGSGALAVSTTVDGYYVNANGEWV